MVRLKVKPKRGEPHVPYSRSSGVMQDFEVWCDTDNQPETVPPPCLPALTSLLSCFATTGDLRANEQCANAARSLHTCMKGSKGGSQASKSSVSTNSDSSPGSVLIPLLYVLNRGGIPRHGMEW